MLHRQTAPHPFESRNRSQTSDDEYVELKHYFNGKLISREVIHLSKFAFEGGTAETDILPGEVGGTVFYNGTYWEARCGGGSTILAGQKVLVVARQSLTLWVVLIA